MKYQYKSEDIVSILNILDSMEVKGIGNIGAILQIFNILNNPIDKIEDEVNKDTE